jgi:cellulose synthase/poly-beta-1,6-N-acetylglucosamine synthase-like glycosyltransferase
MLFEQLPTALAGLVWTSLALVAYAYLGYPVLVHILARLCGRRVAPPTTSESSPPSVSLLISAWNEEKWIADRVLNALHQDFPADRLRVVIASDGSTDRTCQIVRDLAVRYPGRVVLHDFPDRRGKATVLNSVLPQLRSEIVVFSDANTFFDRDAVRHLVRWFGDRDVAAVCGKLHLVDPGTGRNVDSLYWRYENFLKEREARLGALLGANGAVYAIRRSGYVPIPGDTIIDDFVIPLQIKLRTRGRIVYDEGAVAVEETPPHVADEFRRRARIGAGGFQSLLRLWPLALPTAGWTAFAFVSHKVLRWIAPLLLVIALGANLLLLNRPVFQLLLALQLAFYGLAAVGLFLPGNGRITRGLRLATLFTSMNAALAVGFWRWVAGLQGGTWQRTAR